MRYSEIADYPRHWNQKTYPVIAHIEIDKTRLRQFENLIDDQTQTRVLGHDLVDEDQVVVHVACTSDDVRRHLESAWA